MFLIADTHFGDSNIIKYESRPFESVEEMDTVLVENWNKVITDNDIVLVDGDFAVYEFEEVCSICKKLRGHKRLLMGNHDILTIKEYLDCGFEAVYDYPIIIDSFWIVSHEPLYINKNMPYANIFGHIHNNPIYKNISSQSYCISAERIDYTPINIDIIKNAIYNINNSIFENK